MPTIPAITKCAYLGCKNTRSPLNTYCLDHGGKSHIDSKQRKEANAMYNGRLWASLRSSVLSNTPLCQCCSLEGKVTQATDVDHVFPWQLIGKHAFFANVFQSLCRNCHSLKTGLERKGVFRHYAEQGVIDYREDDYLLHNKTAET